jgi:hypothetical protein
MGFRRSTRSITTTAALVLLLAACGTTSPVAGDARVTGVVKLCGGPTDRCFTERISVFVANARRGVVASALRTNGRFSFAVPPGRYTVTARDGVLGRRSVNAVAHKTTRVNIIINIK